MISATDKNCFNCCSCLSFLQNGKKKFKKKSRLDLKSSQSNQPILKISQSSSFDDFSKIYSGNFNDFITERCKSTSILNGSSQKVFLYPEESWAQNASSSYWIISPPFWWNKNKCKIVEVTGKRRFTTGAKIIANFNGSLYIVGSFKQYRIDPDFKLFLTTKISTTDYNLGYAMTGLIERGDEQINRYQTTHFAAIKRNGFDKHK